MGCCLFRIVKSFFIVLFIVLMITIAKGYFLYHDALNEVPLQVKVNEIIQNDNYVTIDNISDYVKKFIVTIEDKRFYTHMGIDIFSVMGSAVSNVFAGYFKYGGSTITQQLAKNFYFSNNKTIVRKIAEAFMAFKLEREYPKHKILEMYLNQIYFGDGYYGIKEASYGYFNTSPKELDEYQASLLVGLPQAPSLYDLKGKNSSMEERYYDVLENLVENNDITKQQSYEFRERFKMS